MPTLTTPYHPPVEQPEILYLDNDLIIVNKPSGLLSVPGRGPDKQDCLVSRIQQNYPEARVVHRLDMPTSGIIVFARCSEAQSNMGRLFQQRKVYKEYIAVVNGVVTKKQGTIDLPLITDWPNRPRQKVDLENGKPSKTQYEVIRVNENDNTSRIKLVPLTGRSHQLRVHMLSIGHVIIGDGLYSAEEQQKNIRLHLHAEKIEFIHPSTNKTLTVIARCPF